MQDTVVIVGKGKAGCIHESIVRGLGYRVVSIDKDPEKMAQFSSVPAVVQQLRDDIFAWIIATPTDSHVSLLSQIADINPGANIVLEKPICRRSEQRLFDEIVDSRRAHIHINDIFRYSNLPDIAGSVLRQFLPIDTVKHISIEFSKDRTTDENQGRFVDREWGVLGHDWFHILSLLHRVIGGELMSDYLARRTSDCTYASVRGNVQPWTAVEETSALLAGETTLQLRCDICAPHRELVRKVICRNDEYELAMAFDNECPGGRYHTVSLIRTVAGVEVFATSLIENHFKNSLVHAFRKFRLGAAPVSAEVRRATQYNRRISEIADTLALAEKDRVADTRHAGYAWAM